MKKCQHVYVNLYRHPTADLALANAWKRKGLDRFLICEKCKAVMNTDGLCRLSDAAADRRREDAANHWDAKLDRPCQHCGGTGSVTQKASGFKVACPVCRR